MTRHQRPSYLPCFLKVVYALALALCANALTHAQTTNATNGSTPAGLTPGAPAGSYGLSGFDNVNLYNGNMNFRLPLISIGGRGGAGYTMMLPIEQHWTVDHYSNPDSGQGIDSPNGNWWDVIKPGYFPGVMQARQVGSLTMNCGTPWSPLKVWRITLTRLTFTANDGTEYELVDQASIGAPQMGSPCTRSRSRGKVFVSHDGSGATFISDSDVMDAYYAGDEMGTTSSDGWTHTSIYGYLFLRDGTRYSIDDGYVTQIRDRNGNLLSFSSDGADLTITDSLNRTVTLNYNYQDVAPYGLCDRITFKGFGGAARIVRVSKTSLGNALKSGWSLQTHDQLFGLWTGSSTPVNPTVVSAVWLPNDDGLNRHYQFYYNSYAELVRVELPTGGAFEYDWAQGLTISSTSGGLFWGANNSQWQIFRRVVEKRVMADGVNVEGRTTFSRPESCTDSNCFSLTNLGYVDVDERDAVGNLLARQRHYFNGGGAAASMTWHSIIPPIVNDMEGRETQTDSYHSNGTTLLRRVLNTWTPPNVFGQGPMLTETNTMLSDTNQVVKQTFSYDVYGNRTDGYEYDFGAGTSGPLVRRTHTDFLTINPVNGADYACDRSTTCGPNANIANVIHIRSLPTQTSIYDAGEVERSRATFEYDSYTSDGNHAALVYRASISELDSAFTTSYTTRGNGTATAHCFLVNGTVTGSITAYAQFDQAGNTVKVIDARGYATNFDFSDRFGVPDGNARLNSAPIELSSPGQASYAFPTLVTNALNQTAYAQFDYYLGKPVDGEDANGVVASGYYNDLLDRPTQVRRAVGTSLQSQSTFSYDDLNRVATTTSDLTTNNDNLLVIKVLYDKLGRTTETRQYEGGSNYIAVQTQYDALGRAYRQSNPFRPWQNETAVWTTSAFDALGRVTFVTTPDDASVKTAYSGNRVLVADQNSSDELRRKRISETDGLGRLKTIWEVTAPDQYTEDVSFPNWPSVTKGYKTTYEYDTLDDLTRVSQGNQPARTFAYDSLKRLTSATNPESGTVSYQYDNNGNLLVKTDARGVSSHDDYDALNRATRRWYNGSSLITDVTHNLPAIPSGVGTSDEVKYFYDSQSIPGAPAFDRGLAIGRLVAMTYGGGSAGDYHGFDALGRAELKIQQTGGINYQTNAIYNLAGAVTSMTYPSGRTITNTFDGTGRLSSFTGNLGDGGTPRTYASGIIYSAFGGRVKEQFGTDTPLFNKSFYNSRGQLAEIRVGTTYTGPNDTGWQRGAIINHYSYQCWGMCSGSNSTTAMTDNNGNLKKQDVYIPDNDPMTSYTMRWQQYEYDSLNRLQWAREISGETEIWRQSYLYDRYGNRTIDQASTWGTGIPKPNFGVDPSTNRLTAPAGYSMGYDQAGNLTNDTFTGQGSREYDAENKMTRAWSNNQWQTYSYDGDGRRIKRIANGTETWQVYGIGGELLAEYAANVSATNPQKEYGYRNGELLITAEPSSSGARTNVALATNGGTATASSAYPGGYDASGANNGGRKGIGAGDYWNDAAPANTFPDWLQIDFNGSKTIEEIDVFTVQDNYAYPSEPTESMTFSLYGLTGFDVQYWNGSAWATVPGGSVSGNNKVWKKITFTAITTTKIRVLTNAAAPADGYSRITEVEAWTSTAAPPPTNVALAANGGMATASSSYPGGYGPGGTINGGRKGDSAGDYWNDAAPANTFPDWLQIDFNGSKTIGEIDVFTIQDNYQNPSEPTESMTFSLYGLTGFDVQYWNGSAWGTVPGGSVSGNNKVWKKIIFTAITTTKIRVLTNAAAPADGYSRITEVEAWTAASGGGSGGSSATIRWLVADHLGTPRMVFDQTGSLANVSRHDYLPFGEEVPGNFRTGIPGYGGGDNVRQKFTSKERDTETGLDYFLARYYSSAQGRFTSPDEFTGGPDELYDFANDASENPTFYADLDDPQSLNKYQYTYNNPLNMTDDDGHNPLCEPCELVRPLYPALPLIPAIPVVGQTALAVTAAVVIYAAIPGDPTGGDGSCPRCDANINAYRRRAEQKADAQDARNRDNSANQGQAEGGLGGQSGRGSRNPATAEAAKEGREQHKDFGEKVKAKPGWRSEPTLKDPQTGRRVRPDAVSRGGRPVELKPNTPSGRAQGRRQLADQERATGKKGRVVYYEPKRKKPEQQR